jgi:hypothetical protein
MKTINLLTTSICVLVGGVQRVLGWYDQNRGGAVLEAPSGDSFTSVSGTFTVPSLTGTSKLSIWVAIGDSVNQNYLLKGGINYNQDLSTFNSWFPSNETDISSTVPVKAADSITVTVSLTSATEGTVVIENKTQNKKSTQTISAPASVDASVLKALTADWFVQAYQAAGELVQVPKFGTLAFSSCSAKTKSGQSIPLTGAGTFEIQGTSGQIYSKTTVTADGVSVKQS